MSEKELVSKPSEACGRVRGRVEALCDRSLAPLQQARDEGHVEACADCAALVAEQRAVIALARGAFVVSELDLRAASHGLDGRIRSASSPLRARWKRRAQTATLAAAALLALVLLREFGFDPGARELFGSLESVRGLDLPALAWPRLPEAPWSER